MTIVVCWIFAQKAIRMTPATVKDNIQSAVYLNKSNIDF
jgi:hypothetical protein